MRTVSIFVCHDDFEQAYLQRCNQNIDAYDTYFLVRLCCPENVLLKLCCSVCVTAGKELKKKNTRR